MISIVVSDDGRGLAQDKITAKAISTGLIAEGDLADMDRDEILELIFQPGFSTAETGGCKAATEAQPSFRVPRTQAC